MTTLTRSMLHPTRISWRERLRPLRDLLGGALILFVWLFLWAWVALGVLAPLGRTGAERPAAVRVLGA